MGNWNPASLLINRDVVHVLNAREEYFGPRQSGKTETLLAYIALFHDDAIIVTKIVPNADRIKRMWQTRYPLLPRPKFMSLWQFERARGLRGTVFTDECDLTRDARDQFCSVLSYGGGVIS